MSDVLQIIIIVSSTLLLGYSISVVLRAYVNLKQINTNKFLSVVSFGVLLILVVSLIYLKGPWINSLVALQFSMLVLLLVTSLFVLAVVIEANYSFRLLIILPVLILFVATNISIFKKADSNEDSFARSQIVMISNAEKDYFKKTGDFTEDISLLNLYDPRIDTGDDSIGIYVDNKARKPYYFIYIGWKDIEAPEGKISKNNLSRGYLLKGYKSKKTTLCKDVPNCESGKWDINSIELDDSTS